MAGSKWTGVNGEISVHTFRQSVLVLNGILDVYQHSLVFFISLKVLATTNTNNSYDLLLCCDRVQCDPHELHEASQLQRHQP
jgi:hypothetical protein